MNETVGRARHILPIIVFSQFAGTSLWFAGNAVIKDLQLAFGLSDHSVASLTAAVQLGFITGTLTFAYFSVSDRVSPRKVFLLCSVLASLVNLSLFLAEGLISVLVVRFCTGFFLAGIYPVGMQIASGWYRGGLGRAIGYLVGALVVGTAFPHLIKSMGSEIDWRGIIAFISILSFAGGIAIYVGVPDGPFLKRGFEFNPFTLFRIFRSSSFRGPAFGYFGHMWELYAFWAFLPWLIEAHQNAHQGSDGLDISLWAFIAIAAGAAGCILGGMVSLRYGSARVAVTQLSVSGLFCLLSPLLFLAPVPVFLAGIVLWGVVVVGDSPQFSTLIARTAPPELVGTSLTLANSLGFLLSIPSLYLIDALNTWWPIQYSLICLFIGPLLGLISMRSMLKAPR